jgi:HJR/Mrr/RecB family endonuclease
MFRFIASAIDRGAEIFFGSLSSRIARMSGPIQFYSILGIIALASLVFSYLHPPNSFVHWVQTFTFSALLIVLVIPIFGGIILQNWALRVKMQPDLAEIRQLRWESFEYFVQLVLEDLGYTVERRGGSQADGGIDLIAHREGKKYIVQCKHYQGERIGVKLVRELIGVAFLQQADGCILITSGLFHDYARREFEQTPFVQLWDGEKIVELLHENSKLIEQEETATKPSISNQLSSVIVSALCAKAKQEEGYIQIPLCRHCGQRMHLVRTHEDVFWGCHNFREQGCRARSLNVFERTYLGLRRG